MQLKPQTPDGDASLPRVELLDIRPMTRRRFRLALAFLTLTWIGVLTLWALFTPALRSPDAPMHYNSIMRVATGGGWPSPGTAPVSTETLRVAKEAGLVPDDRSTLSMFGFTVLIGGTLQNTGPPFSQEEPVPHGLRHVPDFANSPDLHSASDYADNIDQMTQHPPVYYYAIAGLLRLFGGLDWSWDYQLVFISLINIAIMSPLPLLTAYTATQLGLSRRRALVAAGLLLATPQLTFVGSSVSNDPLYIVAGATVIALCAKALRSEPTWSLVAVSGGALGLALLTKAFSLALGLAVVLSFFFSHSSRPWRHRLASGISAGFLGTIVGGWWWMRNILMYGRVQPDGMPDFSPSWADSSPTIGEFLDGSIARLIPTFWGSFGVLELPLPAWVLVVLTLGALLSWTLSLRSSQTRSSILVLTAAPLVIVSLLFWEGWKSFAVNGLVSGLQGRYLFIFVPFFCVTSSMAVGSITRRLPNPISVATDVVLLLSAAAITAYGMFTMARGAYYDPVALIRVSWVGWDAWSPLSLTLLRTTIASTVLTAAAAFFLIVVGGSHRLDNVRPTQKYSQRSSGEGDRPDARLSDTSP